MKKLEEEDAALDEDTDGEATPTASFEGELAAASAARQEAVLEAPPAGFVVAKTTKKVRCLHFIGACGKRPGVHYFSYEVWGDLMPGEADVDTRCKRCFKEGVPASLQPGVPVVEAEPATSSCSSSSSSSASADEEAEKDDRVITPLKRRRRKGGPRSAKGAPSDHSD